MTECQSLLIVDDDARLAETFAIALRGLGFAVATARNGVQGASSYFRNPTDWVISDLETPELGGIETMRCIRAINPMARDGAEVCAGSQHRVARVWRHNFA